MDFVEGDLMPPRRFLPGLLLLFVGSGCAALIYEIVWFQLLSLIIGSSAVSMGVLLGTFMGGMCIGSLFLSKFVSRQQHPLRVYAMLELAIAVFGLLVLWGLPYAGGFYGALACLTLFRAAPYTAVAEDASSDGENPPLIPAGSWPVYLTIGLSGATALAAEAVWTRLLSLLLGATTYTFSLILAAFLVGLGI